MDGLGVPLNRMEPSHSHLEIRLGNEWVSPLMFPRRDVSLQPPTQSRGKGDRPPILGGSDLKSPLSGQETCPNFKT